MKPDYLPFVLKFAAFFALLYAQPIVFAATQAAAAPETTLRVVSYNIHAGRGMDKRIDLPRIAEVLRQINADVILLQEVDMGTKRSGSVMQAAELANLLGMNFYFAKAMDYDGGEYGNAILSRHPFAQTSTLPLIGGVENRSAGIAEIILPRNGAAKTKTKMKAKTDGDGLRVMLVDVHLDARKTAVHTQHAREVSTEVARLTAKRPCAAVIWGGDFNAMETSPIWDVLTKEYGWIMPQKQGATKAERATIPSTKPTREIDWFIYREDLTKTATALTVLEHKVVAEPMASDHCPVVFAVKWNRIR